MERKCSECAYCPENWREKSQLPICNHPKADKRGLWAIYFECEGYRNVKCGEEKKFFESR